MTKYQGLSTKSTLRLFWSKIFSNVKYNFTKNIFILQCLVSGYPRENGKKLIFKCLLNGKMKRKKEKKNSNLTTHQIQATTTKS